MIKETGEEMTRRNQMERRVAREALRRKRISTTAGGTGQGAG